LFDNFKNNVLIELENNHGKGVQLDEETRESYLLLLSTHSIETLLPYVEDPIPVVRAQIFYGLIIKNADTTILKEIVNKHLNDTAKFTTGSTDVIIQWTVIESMQAHMNSLIYNKRSNADLNGWIENIRCMRYENERYSPIAGVHHGIIDKDSLLKLSSLSYSIDGFKTISFTITTYSIIGGTARERTFRSRHGMTRRIKRAIGKSKPGDRIFFDDIKVKFPDKLIRTMTPIALKIK